MFKLQMKIFPMDSLLAIPYTTALLLIVCLILLRITVISLYQLTKPIKKRAIKTPQIEKSCSSSTLIDEVESEEASLLLKLNQSSDLDEFLDTQVELEALKYKSL